MDYLVMIQHDVVAEGRPATEFAFFRHTVANDPASAWNLIKKQYAKPGDTVSAGVVTNKCIPATHVDVSISQKV